MISRVADHCFWLGRYLERAESTARVLAVKGAQLLLVPACGDPEADVAGEGARRTGALTPVGIVAPVSLSGATVTRISLHNWGLVQQKELTIGATVAAMRRGGVIPHLEAVVEPGTGAIEPPATCPSCGTSVEIQGDFVLCPNSLGCPAQSVGILGHYAKVTDIEGFGQVWLDTLVEAGALQSPVDYYTLTIERLMQFDRMGETLARKLVAQIDATRTQPLATFLIQ